MQWQPVAASVAQLPCVDQHAVAQMRLSMRPAAHLVMATLQQAHARGCQAIAVLGLDVVFELQGQRQSNRFGCATAMQMCK